MIPRMLRPGSFLITSVLLLTTATCACGRGQEKQMVPGASIKELIPESQSEEDGVSQILIGQLFKPGPTAYTKVGADALRDAPPLPTGYVLFKELAFRITTKAITSGYQITVFNLPSVASEADFNRLAVLHLEDDEMNPSGRSWEPVTVVPDGWQQHYHFVSKRQYEEFQPDFKSRRVAAVTHAFGVFVVALELDSTATSEPYTKFEMLTSSSPQPVAVGETVTHTIQIKNSGPGAAAEVNLKAELDPDFGYTATSSQGSCRRSDESSGRMLCYLGGMAPGATATITAVGRVSTHVVLSQEISEFGNQLELVFKKNPTDLVDVNSQLLGNFKFKVLKKS